MTATTFMESEAKTVILLFWFTKKSQVKVCYQFRCIS